MMLIAMKRASLIIKSSDIYPIAFHGHTPKGEFRNFWKKRSCLIRVLRDGFGPFFSTIKKDEVIGGIELWRRGRPENRGFWLAEEHWERAL